MGCDIHTAVEVRRNGVWQVPEPWVAKYKDAYGDDTLYPPTRECDGRNYDLFSILANVRNGYGFAGVPTGKGFVPMAMPKGVPEDASPEYLSMVEGMGVDGHSHSYFTVAEIMAYDWTQQTGKQGVVHINEWMRWKVNGKPESWSGDISGSGVVFFTPEEFEAAFVASGADKWAVYHGNKEAVEAVAAKLGAPTPVCSVTWGESYYEAGRELLSETLPRLWRLGAPEDVRLVLFFDN